MWTFSSSDISAKRRSTISASFQKTCTGIRPLTNDYLTIRGSTLSPKAQADSLETIIFELEKKWNCWKTRCAKNSYLIGIIAYILHVYILWCKLWCLHTMTQIHLNVPSTKINNKLCRKTVGSHLLDNTTDKIYMSIIEINICGVSDHSRIATDRYLDQCKPEVVFLNKIEKSIAENTFTNYMTVSKVSIHSTDRVAILIRNGSSFARMEELEMSNSDNLHISKNCEVLRASVTTTYVKPNNRDDLLRLIQGLDVCRVYRLDGVTFFDDCNTRHFYLGYLFCNQLRHDLINTSPIFSILKDGKPTFLSIKGYRVIDICICYGNFINKYDWNLTIDEEFELFTEAPSREVYSAKT